MVDPVAAAGLGAAPTIETDIIALSACSVSYPPPPGTLTAPNWSLAVKVGAKGILRIGAQPDKIDGAEVLVQAQSPANSCTYLLPLGPIAAGALQRLRAPALRTQTHISPDTPFALRDPCAGVPALARAHAVAVQVERSELYTCRMKLEGKDDVFPAIQVAADPRCPAAERRTQSPPRWAASPECT